MMDDIIVIALILALLYAIYQCYGKPRTSSPVSSSATIISTNTTNASSSSSPSDITEAVVVTAAPPSLTVKPPGASRIPRLTPSSPPITTSSSSSSSSSSSPPTLHAQPSLTTGPPLPLVYSPFMCMNAIDWSAARTGSTRSLIASTKLWPRQEHDDDTVTVRIRFLGGTVIQTEKVMSVAHEWEEVCGIRFQFVSGGDTDIRISFEADGTSWSMVGTDANRMARGAATMNLGWVSDNDVVTAEDRRGILHELGHAIGLEHEHQPHTQDIRYNEGAILKLYRGAPHYWNEDKIRRVILRRSGTSSYSNVAEQRDPQRASFAPLDRRSVMLYTIPPQLVVGDPVGFPLNSKLSRVDKEFAAYLYAPPAIVTPVASFVPMAPPLDDEELKAATIARDTASITDGRTDLLASIRDRKHIQLRRAATITPSVRKKDKEMKSR